MTTGDVIIGLRLPDALVRDIDAYAEVIHQQSGIPVARTAAIRALIIRGLSVSQELQLSAAAQHKKAGK